MPTWTRITIPQFAERYIALSLARENRFVVISYDGVHVISLEPAVEVTTDETDPEGWECYDFERRIIQFQGEELPAMGLHGGTPLTESPDGTRLHISPKKGEWESRSLRRVLLKDRMGGILQELEFRDLSGDWQVATFSTDFKYIVVGTPYQIYAFRRGEESG